MIWHLIMPLVYIVAFFILYTGLVSGKVLKFNISAISTTLIYVFISF